jgi:hypothetical protein
MDCTKDPTPNPSRSIAYGRRNESLRCETLASGSDNEAAFVWRVGFRCHSRLAERLRLPNQSELADEMQKQKWHRG